MCSALVIQQIDSTSYTNVCRCICSYLWLFLMLIFCLVDLKFSQAKLQTPDTFEDSDSLAE